MAKAKAQTELHLHTGEEHTLKLESLLTAGYEWTPEVEGDADVAEVEKQDATEDEELAIGAAPDEVFMIKARRPGRTTIRLAQRRPWEHDGQPANEYVVNVDVAE
jgi:predicted secreted protein